MKLKTFCHAHNVLGCLDESDKETLRELVNDILVCWHEDDSEQLYWIVDESGKHLTTLMSGEDKNDAIVTFRDGTCERYKCVYHLDANGNFERSEVARVN